jgi:hypothetical protein
MDLHGLDFEIVGTDGAEQTGSNGHVSMTVLPDGPAFKKEDGDTDSRMRKRYAIKKACTPAAYKVCWLYGELDGVRCYLKQDEDGQIHAVLTKQDLYP